jgi:hypothetical protein
MFPKIKITETTADYKVSFEGVLSKSNPFTKYVIDFLRSMERTPASPIDPDLESRL